MVLKLIICFLAQILNFVSDKFLEAEVCNVTVYKQRVTAWLFCTGEAAAEALLTSPYS